MPASWTSGDEVLVEEGAYIMLRRSRTVGELSSLLTELHGELTETGEELSIDYAPGVLVEHPEGAEFKRALQLAIEQSAEREIALGATQSGPHRDDVRLTLGGMDAGVYASRGQARTLAVALKLVEGMLLERERGESPVLLLDDVLSELDATRRRLLLGAGRAKPAGHRIDHGRGQDRGQVPGAGGGVQGRARHCHAAVMVRGYLEVQSGQGPLAHQASR